MWKHYDKLKELDRLHNGIVSHQQLVAADIPRSSIRLGAKLGWTRLHKALWYVRPDPPDFQTWLNAAPLAFGPDAMIGGAAALYVHIVLSQAPPVIDIWVPSTKGYRNHKDSPFRVRRDHGDRIFRKAPHAPFTSLGDALLDYLNEEQDPIAAASAIIMSRKRAPKLPQLLTQPEYARTRQRHRAQLAELMNCEPAYDSVLELLWVTNVEVPHRMTPLERQWICKHRHRHDGAWVHLKSIVELDGDAYHGDERTIKKDRDKDIDDRRDGFITYRFTYADVAHYQCRTAATLAEDVAGLAVSPCGERCPVKR